MDELLDRVRGIDKRQARIESRLVQLMLFLGADPTERYTPQTCGKKIDGPNRTEGKLRIDDADNGKGASRSDGGIVESIKRRLTGSSRG